MAKSRPPQAAIKLHFVPQKQLASLRPTLEQLHTSLKRDNNASTNATYLQVIVAMTQLGQAMQDAQIDGTACYESNDCGYAVSELQLVLGAIREAWGITLKLEPCGLSCEIAKPESLLPDKIVRQLDNALEAWPVPTQPRAGRQRGRKADFDTQQRQDEIYKKWQQAKSHTTLKDFANWTDISMPLPQLKTLINTVGRRRKRLPRA